MQGEEYKPKTSNRFPDSDSFQPPSMRLRPIRSEGSMSCGRGPVGVD